MAETIRLDDARPSSRGDRRGQRGPDFVPALAAAMIEKLRLRQDDLLVDLGCGAAAFDLEILRQVPLHYQIIAVDECEERTARIPAHAGIRCVQMDLATFCEMPVRYDKIVWVDALPCRGGLGRSFAGLFERLNDGGVLLMVDLGDTWRPHAGMLGALLRESGFSVERGSVTLGVGARVGMITATRPRPQ